MTKAPEVLPHPEEIYLGGRWERGDGGRQPIVSPATEEIVAEVALPSLAQAERAVAAAHQVGLPGWARLGVLERVAAVRRMCELIEARLDEAGRLWALEAGMPVRYSAVLHRFGAVGAWRSALEAAESALADQTRSGPMGEVLLRREPAGVVVGVMAYNGPLVTMGTKIIPALLAGCPVVVKAAPESQLVLRMVADCAAQALPEGALSILCGEADLGRALTRDPRVDMVSLTGGHAAAQDIIEATRARLARTHLELGGKSAALILPDADLDRALRTLVPGATSGTGQVCALLSRVLVPESRHDEVVDALAQHWSALTIGDPLDTETAIGPLANRAAFERTMRAVDQARAEGGRVVTGGSRPAGRERGWFFEPTIVTAVGRESTLARREVFGPVTAVMTYADIDDAIDLANATDYGLAATVYTADRELGLACAARLQAGSIGLNAYGPDVTAPWGGRKGSGWGREGGAEGLWEFTELKQIVLGPGLPSAGVTA